MPVKSTWPWQLGLTYPYNSAATAGGLYDLIDENNFQIRYDRYQDLDWNKNLQYTMTETLNVNTPFEFFSDTNQTSINDSSTFRKIPYLFILPAMDPLNTLGQWPLYINLQCRVYYTDN